MQHHSFAANPNPLLQPQGALIQPQAAVVPKHAVTSCVDLKSRRLRRHQDLTVLRRRLRRAKLTPHLRRSPARLRSTQLACHKITSDEPSSSCSTSPCTFRNPTRSLLAAPPSLAQQSDVSSTHSCLQRHEGPPRDSPHLLRN